MQKRIAYLDIARSLAIISVSFNHAVNRSFNIRVDTLIEFQSIPLWLTIIKVVLYALSRIGVPLFLMISGVLLLPRDYSGDKINRFVKHNWLQLFITTEIWLVIMYWYKQCFPGSFLLAYGKRVCLIRFIETVFFINPDTLGSMWYMFMIICLYLMIPIIAMSLKKLEPKYFVIPGSIVLFCSFILPDINAVLQAIGHQGVFETRLQSANIFSMYAVFLLFGYFISEGALSRVKTNTLLGGMLCVFIAFCAFQFWIYTTESDYVVGEDYASIFPLIIGVLLFELLHRARINEKSMLARLATELSKITFGIYFVHICIMEGMWQIIDHYGININYLWRFCLLETVSVLGSIVLIQIFRHNKWMSKNLFGIK